MAHLYIWSENGIKGSVVNHTWNFKNENYVFRPFQLLTYIVSDRSWSLDLVNIFCKYPAQEFKYKKMR